jgi:hypothetical protein
MSHTLDAVCDVLEEHFDGYVVVPLTYFSSNDSFFIYLANIQTWPCLF